MWDWFHLRRRNRRRAREASRNDVNVTRNTQNTETQIESHLTASGPRPIARPFLRIIGPILESPPKCISRVPCSQILYGERVEDFSQDCWLENHLHRFGAPSNQPLILARRVPTLSPLNEDSDDSITGSSENESNLTDSCDLDVDNEVTFTPVRPRLALEELFVPLGQSDNETDLDMSFEACEPIEPPPYSEFDLPPSYEEAVGNSDCRSTGTRSSNGSSLAFMW